MSLFHQIEFSLLLFSFLVACMQSMTFEESELMSYEEWVTGYDKRKILIQTPKNLIKINLVVLFVYIVIEVFVYSLVFLGGL